MSENQSIFTETPVQGEAVPPVIPTVTIPPEVSEFVGEGKKYKSVEDALKSVPNAQKHISTIEQENAALKAELEKRKTTEEILDQIKSGIVPNETPLTTAIDANAVSTIVQQQIQAIEARKTYESNTKAVITEFTKQYGEKAEEKFISLAQENGLTIDALNRLSATSPNVVLKLAGIGSKQTFSTGSQSSSVNTEALGQNQQPQELSAKVPKFATTKDVVNAWKIAGEKVKQKIS